MGARGSGLFVPLILILRILPQRQAGTGSAASMLFISLVGGRHGPGQDRGVDDPLRVEDVQRNRSVAREEYEVEAEPAHHVGYADDQRQADDAVFHGNRSFRERPGTASVPTRHPHPGCGHNPVREACPHTPSAPMIQHGFQAVVSPASSISFHPFPGPMEIDLRSGWAGATGCAAMRPTAVANATVSSGASNYHAHHSLPASVPLSTTGPVSTRVSASTP